MIHVGLRLWQCVGMAQTVSILLNAADRQRLAEVAADRNRPLKHVQRANIILHSADRLPVLEVARRAGVSRPAVWRWQLRFAEQGVDGLLRDKTRPPGTQPLPAATVAKIVAKTCAEPPGSATHWTGRAIAKVFGVSLRSIQRIWKAHRLEPHRWRSFKRSSDPAFAEKVEDIVGLYMNPPAHAVVVSIDEKSQIQALDRTQPGLPLKPGKAKTMTHDYKRNGTTTLFAALDILSGTVVGRCMQKHTHAEFIKFLNAVERAVPAGKIIHAIADNYATHKHPRVRAWLADHPRWVLHFTPTSASWLNAVEGFFSALTRRAIRRGSFASVQDLQNTIVAYIKRQNAHPKPFTWTTPAKTIFAKLAKIPEPSV
jgi:transposase